MSAKPLDLAGRRFGRLVALRDAGKLHGRRVWLCQCDCGERIRCIATDLTRDRVKSCGCLKTTVTHGSARRGQKSPEYLIWVAMHQRCENPRNKGYSRYGARGITVCESWRDYAVFLSDMGPRPTRQHSIDRTDGSKGYSPENCRWATAREQASNTSRNIVVIARGERMTLMQAVEKHGGRYGTILGRIKRGQSFDEARGL